MVTLRMLASRLGALFHKRRLESDLADEMRAHLAMLTEENVRRGMLPEDARYAALRE